MLCADPASSRQADQWTDQETLLLLEGIELYNENWDQIADHVGSKSKEQCLLHFIRLPVEDSFIEENFAHIDGSAKPTASSIPVKEESNSQSNGIHTNLPKKKRKKRAYCFAGSVEQAIVSKATPFSSSSNPLMMMVAFLASSVNPTVAAAAAHAALESLTNKKEEKNESDGQIAETEIEKAKEDGNSLSRQNLQAATAAAVGAAVLKAKVRAPLRLVGD